MLRIAYFGAGTRAAARLLFVVTSTLLVLAGLPYLGFVQHNGWMPTLSVGIDPGHGGRDPGASSSGLIEKEITLDVALRLMKALEQHDVSVFLTRDHDISLGRTQRQDLAARIHAVTRAGADLLVSIHVNTFHMPHVAGPRTYYHPGSASGMQLATEIQAQLHRASQRGRPDAYAEEYFITQRSPMTAVLVEIGYMTNHAEAQQLRTESYRQRIAEAIARGIVAYISAL